MKSEIPWNDDLQGVPLSIPVLFAALADETQVETVEIALSPQNVDVFLRAVAEHYGPLAPVFIKWFAGENNVEIRLNTRTVLMINADSDVPCDQCLIQGMGKLANFIGFTHADAR